MPTIRKKEMQAHKEQSQKEYNKDYHSKEDKISVPQKNCSNYQSYQLIDIKELYKHII